MKIAIIGAGNVGGTLGKGWAKKGHTVMFGVRDAANPKVAALVKEAGAGASSGSVREAAAFADVVVLTTPWDAAQDALRSAGFYCVTLILRQSAHIRLGARSKRQV